MKSLRWVSSNQFSFRVETVFEDLDFQLEELDTSAIGPVEFEKLLFHLLDEMGFRELVWRKGGEGNSATDGGRDLEAQYWSLGPTSTKAERYWFEAKFRSSQLEKLQVQIAVNNAQGRRECDHLVILTNTTVSNPCIDWVKEFQSQHKVPAITIWQGHDLELILRRSPRTLARFFPTALSFSGRCKVIESRFNNLFMLPSLQELEDLWKIPELTILSTHTLLAAVFAEVAYGDVDLRRWGMRFSAELLHGLLGISLVNTYPFLSLCINNGRSQRLFVDGIAYLIMCCLIRGSAESTAKIMIRPAELLDFEPEHLTNEETARRWDPPLRRVYDILAHRCSENSCIKLHYNPFRERSYFDRFKAGETPPKHKDRFLVLQSTKDACPLGLVDQESLCPLADGEGEDAKILPGQLEEYLRFAESVLRMRTNEPINSGH